MSNLNPFRSATRLALGVVAWLVVVLVGALLVPDAGEAKKRKKARKDNTQIYVKATSFPMTYPDQKRRSAVTCGGGKTVVPLGGGAYTTPTPGPDGEGVYPHSYERLGAQRGFHVTPVLYDPSPSQTTKRSVTMQVVCGPKSTHITPIRATVYVQPGQNRTAQATCPGKRRLFAGGFQRTNFVTRGGNYVTASFMLNEKTWQVNGSAFGRFGGELTAIAYCRSSGKPLLQEVEASTGVSADEYSTATTGPCPGAQRLIAGGFRTFPAGPVLISDGFIDDGNTWTAGGYNAFGAQSTLTAYGYCHSPSFPRARKEANPYRSVKAPPALKEAEKASMSERVLHGGCYPDPPVLAKGIAKRTKLKTDVADNHKGVDRAGVVYVLRQGAGCNTSRLSLRKAGKVFTINSATGMVSVK